MKQIFQNIKGDRLIWALVALLAMFSFLPVYSASSNLAYTYGNGNTISFLVRHFVHLILGFTIMFAVHKIPYRYFRGLSLMAMPFVIVLLVVVFDPLALTLILASTKQFEWARNNKKHGADTVIVKEVYVEPNLKTDAPQDVAELERNVDDKLRKKNG